jgi:hypothetical protein
MVHEEEFTDRVELLRELEQWIKAISLIDSWSTALIAPPTNRKNSLIGPVTTPELTLYASTQVGGHPYYLYCLATSKCEGKSFKDEKAIDQVIRYENEIISFVNN